MADKTLPVNGDTGFKILYKDQGGGVYVPAVSDLSGGGGGGSSTFQGLTDRLPFTIANAAQSAVQFQAHAGQTADIVDFIDSGGTARVWVGSLTQVGDSTLAVSAITSQTGPVLDIRDDTGVTILQIEPSGRISTPPVTDLTIRAGTGGNVLLGSGSVSVLNVQGSQIIQTVPFLANTTGTVGLIVQGKNGQTADLMRWQDFNPTTLARINKVGGLQLEGSDTASKLLVAPAGTATVAANDALIQCNADACTALMIRGFSGTQSGNLTEWQTSGGTLQSAVDPAGRFGIGVAPVSTQRLTVLTTTASHKVAVLKAASAQTASVLECQDNGGTARVTVSSLTATADHTLILKLITSQSGDLFRLVNASDVVLGHVDSTGKWIIGSSQFGTPGALLSLHVGQFANSAPGIIIRTGSSQAVNAQEWQDSGGVARAAVGSLTATTDATLALRAITSQTGAMIETQDTSAVAKFRVNAAGQISMLAGNAITITSTAVQLANSGGNVAITNGSTNGGLQLQGAGGNFTANACVQLRIGTSLNSTSTAQVLAEATGTFAPTSGTAAFTAFQVTPTINQTGGANGNYTAALVNVTETAVGGTGTLLDLQVGASSKFKVSNAGVITLVDAGNIVLGTSTGTKIGTAGGAAGQKIGFFNATPVVQQLVATGAGRTVDDVITALQTLGLFRQS